MKILTVVVVVLLLASVSYARGIVEELTSIVKATTSGVTNTVSNLNPGKILSDTADTTAEATRKAGEATTTVATDTVGVVGKAVGSK